MNSLSQILKIIFQMEMQLVLRTELKLQRAVEMVVMKLTAEKL